MNLTQPIDTVLAPFFDDVATAHAVVETILPEAKVRAVVQATFWFQACVGAIGFVDPSAVANYRAWRVEWLTRVVRPRFVEVDGKFVVQSFVEGVLREPEAS